MPSPKEVGTPAPDEKPLPHPFGRGSPFLGRLVAADRFYVRSGHEVSLHVLHGGSGDATRQARETESYFSLTRCSSRP